MKASSGDEINKVLKEFFETMRVGGQDLRNRRTCIEPCRAETGSEFLSEVVDEPLKTVVVS
jgi:hypothetical protein